jgi:hypothetical protein
MQIVTSPSLRHHMLGTFLLKPEIERCFILDEEHQVAAAAVMMLLQTSRFPNEMCHKTKFVSANSGIALSSSSSSFVKVLIFTKAQNCSSDLHLCVCVHCYQLKEHSFTVFFCKSSSKKYCKDQFTAAAFGHALTD